MGYVLWVVLWQVYLYRIPSNLLRNKLPIGPSSHVHAVDFPKVLVELPPPTHCSRQSNFHISEGSLLPSEIDVEPPFAISIPVTGHAVHVPFCLLIFLGSFTLRPSLLLLYRLPCSALPGHRGRNTCH